MNKLVNRVAPFHVIDALVIISTTEDYDEVRKLHTCEIGVRFPTGRDVTYDATGVTRQAALEAASRKVAAGMVLIIEAAGESV